uniref:Uncharacterized protein n=1 Tax=Cacopsylla melanoneura TaxID=428564 RepID=A0A8D8LT38_9HEMI
MILPDLCTHSDNVPVLWDLGYCILNCHRWNAKLKLSDLERKILECHRQRRLTEESHPRDLSMRLGRYLSSSLGELEHRMPDLWQSKRHWMKLQYTGSNQ